MDSNTAGVPANTSADTFDAILASVVGGISTYRNTQKADAAARAAEAAKINPTLAGSTSAKPVLIAVAVIVVALLVFEG